MPQKSQGSGGARRFKWSKWAAGVACILGSMVVTDSQILWAYQIGTVLLGAGVTLALMGTLGI